MAKRSVIQHRMITLGFRAPADDAARFANERWRVARLTCRTGIAKGGGPRGRRAETQRRAARPGPADRARAAGGVARRRLVRGTRHVRRAQLRRLRHGIDEGDRESVALGKSVSVRVDLSGRRIIKKKSVSCPLRPSVSSFYYHTLLLYLISFFYVCVTIF